MIRIIEKVIDFTITGKGELKVSGKNAPIVYCLLEHKKMRREFKNIIEVIIKPNNVLSAVAEMYNAGIRINIENLFGSSEKKF